jgi:hypothetical protein
MTPVAGTFRQAGASLQQQLQESLAELATLRAEIAKEKVPLAEMLSDLEDQLLEVRREYQQTARLLDSRTLDLSNLHCKGATSCFPGQYSVTGKNETTRKKAHPVLACLGAKPGPTTGDAVPGPGPQTR